MESTSCGEKCPFVKAGLCQTEKDCPNFVESWWVKEGDQPKLVTDCSPKRILLQQIALQSRLEGLQKAQEQMRNEYVKLSDYLAVLIAMSKKVIENPKIEERKNETNLIDDINPFN